MTYLYHVNNRSATFTYMLWTHSRTRSFPPIYRGRPYASSIRFHAMPCFGGQPLPRRLYTCPALCSSAPVRSPISHGHCFGLHPPVGYSCRVSERPSRSRFRSGWVKSPRIVIPAEFAQRSKARASWWDMLGQADLLRWIDAPAPRPGCRGVVVNSLAKAAGLSVRGRPSRPRSPRGIGLGRSAAKAPL